MKGGKLFFFGALFVAVLWASLEFYLFLDSQKKSAESCSWKAAEPFILKNQILLASVQDHGEMRITTFDWKTESLHSFAWIADANLSTSAQQAKKLEPSFSLRCERPSYQCFASKENGGYSTLSVPFLSRDIALVEGVRGERRSLFPVLVSPQGISINDPIKMCGQVPNAESTSFFINGRQLLAFDNKTSRLAIWSGLSFAGTSTAAAAREPDQIFAVAGPFGLIESSCDQAPHLMRSSFSMHEGMALLQWSDGASSQFSIFNLEPSLSPEPQARLSVNGDQLKGLSEGTSSLILDSPKELIQVLGARDKVAGNFELRNFVGLPREPLFEFSLTHHFLASLSARFFWRGLLPRLHFLDKTLTLPYLPGPWRVKAIPRFFMQTMNETTKSNQNIAGYLGWQQEWDLAILPFACKAMQ